MTSCPQAAQISGTSRRTNAFPMPAAPPQRTEPASANDRWVLATVPTVVLDTNVVLDWVVFQNPGCVAFASAIEDGSVRWLASRAMRDELAHVLSRGVVDRWAPDPSCVWAQWSRHAVELADAPPADTPASLRCTDPDDQKFIDFAVMHRTQWLITRDRAVLKLGKRARALGLDIVTPQVWPITFCAHEKKAARKPPF